MWSCNSLYHLLLCFIMTVRQSLYESLGMMLYVGCHGEKSGDISGSIISTLRNLTRILMRILILLLGGLLVLLTFIELLTNHGSGTGVQGMATAANITSSERKRH